MSHKINYQYEKYYDKVLGCFIGKCVCGTIGAPYEGMKQVLNLSYTPEMLQKSIPNDDLDIQIIWLEVLEQYGEHFTSIDLADAFYHKYPHCPGEYAYFKKNYERKILPPASGRFNNQYYENGMGCPIRSEIWACINPASPDSAVQMAQRDGCLDHSFDSIIAEQYLAALQSMAFLEEDLQKLLTDASIYLQKSTRLSSLYNEVRTWYSEGQDFYRIRDFIIREYGHPDCTNLYQNMGIIWLALLYGQGDIINTTLLAVNCGFDTDCTAATVGSILGLIQGGEQLRKTFQIEEVYYVAEAFVNRPDNKVSTLANDIAEIGVYLANKGLLETVITDQPHLPSFFPIQRDETFEVRYEGKPIVQDGIPNRVHIMIRNNRRNAVMYTIDVEGESEYRIEYPNQVMAEPNENVTISITITAVGINKNHSDTSIFTIRAEANNTNSSVQFGLYKGVTYSVYGPYWENNITIPPLKAGENYYQYLTGIDEIREYHLNVASNFSKAYLDMKELAKGDIEGFLSKKVTLYEDMFSMSDLFGFTGPCIAYLTREIVIEKAINCMLYIGKSDKIEVWLNDEQLLLDQENGYCTCENRHLLTIKLQTGTNRLVAKISRTSHEAYYSIIFVEEGEPLAFPKHLLV